MHLDYKSHKFLLIEESKTYFKVIVDMLRQLGAKDLDFVHSPLAALKNLRKKNYSILISAYHFRGNRNGQQLLEEISDAGLIKPDTCFVLVTSDPSIELATSCCEHRPHSYLLKPLSVAMLNSNLVKTTAEVSTFKEARLAQKSADYMKSYQLVEEIGAKNRRYLLRALRMKAELLIQMQDYTKASQIYETILDTRFVAWAKFGLAQVKYYQEEYLVSEDILSELLSINCNIIAAYDWMAKNQLKLDDEQGAKESLTKAVALSPGYLQRQMHLAELAKKSDDIDLLERVLNRCMIINRETIPRQSEPYCLQIEFLLGQLEIQQPKKNTPEKFKQCHVLIDEFNQSFKRDISLQFLSLLYQYHNEHLQGDRTNLTQLNLEITEHYFKHQENLTSNSLCMYARHCVLKDEIPMAESIMNQLVQHEDDTALSGDMLKFVTDINGCEEAQSAFDTRDFRKSLDLFRILLKKYPTSIHFNVMAFYSAIDLMLRDKNTDPALLGLSELYLSKIEKKYLSHSDARHFDYHYKKFRAMQTRRKR